MTPGTTARLSFLQEIAFFLCRRRHQDTPSPRTTSTMIPPTIHRCAP
ncbi:hypothetical protein SOVF_168880 [Spinacia oleracea]|nr:hypothetical protein SOVF_168880 [Spinacia oleracea]